MVISGLNLPLQTRWALVASTWLVPFARLDYFISARDFFFEGSGVRNVAKNIRSGGGLQRLIIFFFYLCHNAKPNILGLFEPVCLPQKDKKNDRHNPIQTNTKENHTCRQPIFTQPIFTTIYILKNTKTTCLVLCRHSHIISHIIFSMLNSF